MRINPATTPFALAGLVLLVLFVRGHPTAQPGAPGAGASAPVAGASPTAPITREPPDRLDRSGDDLYWTITRRFGPGVTVATVQRARGDAVTVVFREFGVSFGDVAGGRFVVVNDDRRGLSRIERLDRGGSPATGQRLIGRRDLLTDGAALYWADAAGVRTVATGGGPVRTLARSAGVRAVALDGDRLYYAAGPAIRSTGTHGGPTRTEVRTRAAVTALAVLGGRLYWSELGAGVRQRGGVLRSAVAGRVVTELSAAAGRLVWVDCTVAGDDCVVRTYGAGGFTAGADAHDVQDDGTTIGYAGAGGVVRQVLSGHRLPRLR